MTAWLRAGVVLLAVLCARSASADADAAQPWVATNGNGDRGWLVVTRESGRESDDPIVELVHVPPRGAGESRIGDLVLRPAVLRLRDMPNAIASVGDRAFMVFGVEDGRRSVLSIRAIATLPGQFAYEPRGRSRVERSIDSDGELVGFTGALGTAWALLAGDTGPELLRLDDEGWAEAELPAAEFDAITLAGDDDSLLIITQTSAWCLDRDGVWSSAFAWSDDASIDGATVAGGELFTWSTHGFGDQGREVVISRASANGLREIATIEADAAAVVAMAREGRLM
ncbi:MAG: hypothetical protein AAF747_05230, partial [Planctomycetota bacterium]